jgi:ribosome-binding protein aMBF1 (putative translation factor)
MATFGDYIKKEREKSDMTQDKLSKVLDIPYTDVSKIERGKKKFKFEKLPDLAKVLKVNLQHLKDLYGADIMVAQKEKYECSDKVFSVAENQARYVKNKNFNRTKAIN